MHILPRPGFAFRGRTRHGQLMPCHPSRFLKELPPELVENAEARDKQPVDHAAGKKMFDVIRSAVTGDKKFPQKEMKNSTAVSLTFVQRLFLWQFRSIKN